MFLKVLVNDNNPVATTRNSHNCVINAQLQDIHPKLRETTLQLWDIKLEWSDIVSVTKNKK